MFKVSCTLPLAQIFEFHNLVFGCEKIQPLFSQRTKKKILTKHSCLDMNLNLKKASTKYYEAFTARDIQCKQSHCIDTLVTYEIP